MNRGSRAVHLATAARTTTPDARRTAVIVFAILFLGATAVTLWPFVAPLILSAWAAHLARPLFVRLRTALHGRERGASMLTAIFVLLAILPIAIGIMTLIPAAKSLLEQLRSASGSKGVLAALVSNGGAGGITADGKGLVTLAKDYGAGASRRP